MDWQAPGPARALGCFSLCALGETTQAGRQRSVGAIAKETMGFPCGARVRFLTQQRARDAWDDAPTTQIREETQGASSERAYTTCTLGKMRAAAHGEARAIHHKRRSRRAMTASSSPRASEASAFCAKVSDDIAYLG